MNKKIPINFWSMFYSHRKGAKYAKALPDWPRSAGLSSLPKGGEIFTLFAPLRLIKKLSSERIMLLAFSILFFFGTVLAQEEVVPQNQAPDANSMAVLYFKNADADSAYAPLEAALADMIITDLSQVPSLKIVERTRMSSLMQEKEFQMTEYVAGSDTAAEGTGGLLQVARALTGQYKVTEEKELMVKTSLISTADNSLTPAGKVKGPVEKFFEIEKKLVFNVIEQMGIKLTDEERKKIQVIKTENLLALLAYGTGIMAQDRGDNAAAAAAFSKAVALDPNFKQAGALAKTASDQAAAEPGESSPSEAEEPVVEITGSGVQALKDHMLTKEKQEIEADMEMAGDRSDASAALKTASQPETRPDGQFRSHASTTTRISNAVGGSFMPEAGEISDAPAADDQGSSSSSQAGITTPGERNGFMESQKLGITSVAPKTVKVKISIPTINN